MSDETNTAVQPRVKLRVELDLEAKGYAIGAESEVYEKSHRDGLKFVANIFSEGRFKGLCWTSLEPAKSDQLSLDAMIEQWGVGAVVSYAAAAIRNAQRNKAKNSAIPTDVSDDTLSKMRDREPIFYTEEQVAKWVPGEREMTIKQYDTLIRECVDQIKDKKIAQEEKVLIRRKMSELMQARTELTLREVELEGNE